MPKTNFTAGVSKITATFANLIFRHNHLGLDEDGSNPKITRAELADGVVALLDQLAGVIPVINRIGFQSMAKVSVFGGSGLDGAFTASAIKNSLPDGVYNFTNFTIPAGFTVNATGGICRIKVTGTCQIDGSLVGTPDTNSFTATGALSTSDPPYNLEASLRGSSGAISHNNTDLTGVGVRLGRGGKPGTSIIIECLGNLNIGAAGSIISDGGVGDTPDILSGANSVTGAGGGTGGAIALMSFTKITQAGSVSVKGGKGGDSRSNLSGGRGAKGGGGGSGGYVYLAAPAVVTDDTKILLNGGVAGAPVGDASYPAVSGGSYAGRGGDAGLAGGTGKLIKVISEIFHIY